MPVIYQPCSKDSLPGNKTDVTDFNESRAWILYSEGRSNIKKRYPMKRLLRELDKANLKNSLFTQS